MKDLGTQQLTLASSDYDLRITNLARFIYKMLPAKKGSLIDIGAGNGLILKFFKLKGFEVSGVELEKDQVHQMQIDYKLQGVKVVQGDITKMKGNEEFDVVIASDVIEHIEDDASALKNLYSFVKIGGYLVITVPAHMHLYGKRDKKWGHYRRYDKDILISKINELTDSRIVSVSYWNILGYFAYFFFEKIMNQPIKEEFRYKQTLLSKLIRGVLDLILKLEELIGGPPIGLTLIAVAQKNEGK